VLGSEAAGKGVMVTVGKFVAGLALAAAGELVAASSAITAPGVDINNAVAIAQHPSPSPPAAPARFVAPRRPNNLHAGPDISSSFLRPSLFSRTPPEHNRVPHLFSHGAVLVFGVRVLGPALQIFSFLALWLFSRFKVTSSRSCQIFFFQLSFAP
jgi:hypothetical protein